MTQLQIRSSIIATFALAMLSLPLIACSSEPVLSHDKILVIGDSVALGAGAKGTEQDCPLSPETSSLEASFASLLAEDLNAELTLLAWPGKGLVRNYNDANSPTIEMRLATPANQERMQGLNKFGVVIIEVGTNDFFQNDATAEFIPAYIDLLENMSVQYSDAHILTISGPMLNGDDSARFRSAVSSTTQQVAAKHDTKIDHIDASTLATGQNDFACQWHPSAALHDRLKNAIMDKLQ